MLQTLHKTLHKKIYNIYNENYTDYTYIEVRKAFFYIRFYKLIKIEVLNIEFNSGTVFLCFLSLLLS